MSVLFGLHSLFSLDKRLIDDPGSDDEEPLGAFCVADIATDHLKSDYIAVSFEYKHTSNAEKSFRLPFVCLYLCSTRPHFSATFLSIIDNQSSSNNGIAQLIFPVEVSFNRNQLLEAGAGGGGGAGGRERGESVPVQVAIRWSNQVVSFSPCHTDRGAD